MVATKKRPTPTQKQVAGIANNWALRLSPSELRSRIELEDSLIRQHDESCHVDAGESDDEEDDDYDEDASDALSDDECPAFDDMDGDE